MFKELLGVIDALNVEHFDRCALSVDIGLVVILEHIFDSDLSRIADGKNRCELQSELYRELKDEYNGGS